MLHEERAEEILAKRARNAAKRDTEGITEEMREDIMKLLDAFDLPFVIAPFEAEAQCAVLESLGLVDGVVTEDSDAFLFGAKTIYRNIFNDKKFVEVRAHCPRVLFCRNIYSIQIMVYI
jgi:DNA excision repair protein ERCC-5